ncbi:hypothetical protein [Jeotgalibacillus campisalis]|uniref:Uncharacterized protein n=1 Tax=Jeotgalibacillus campisalis TaxID=220754 RepID=A0A0C2RN98_9BACL|nr:hypothetical protein [Jeotgalibacillus campisalis]KIL43264.1 hypothetical protein KR50_36670 [Jeotgalibacillus campisalis]
MKDYLNEVRSPIKISIARRIIYSALLIVAGMSMGIVSKMLDEKASNSFPFILEVLDLGNFFSRMGVWIFLAVLLCVYSKSPVRSAFNVFLFFAAMVGSYYLYTVLAAGFFPQSYMMIWISMTVISPFLAFICWYAKGKGILAIFISSLLILFMSRQAFVVGFWYFDIRYILEFLLWIATIFVLYQSPKQIIKVVFIGLLLYFLTAQTNLIWGML